MLFSSFAFSSSISLERLDKDISVGIQLAVACLIFVLEGSELNTGRGDAAALASRCSIGDLGLEPG